MSHITIINNEDSQQYNFKDGSLLIDVLRDCGFLMDAPCGGHGLCGKCRVSLVIDSKEQSVLACHTVVSNDCCISISDNTNLILNNSKSVNTSKESIIEDEFAVAIDLGTTTIEISLINLSSKERVDTIREYNWQRTYGADVISRIDYCINNEDGLTTLSNLVKKQILSMINSLCDKHSISINSIKKGFLAGNTTMQHILAGIDPKSIALAPFTPSSYFIDDKNYFLGNIPISLAPCISGYVGGDIVSGLTTLNLGKEKILFIDIGTNGEMAIGNSESLNTCSVACGPAFEGAEISCGMHAVNGAINKVFIENDKIAYNVINDEEAKGICGSGLVDLISVLLELNYLDESGYLDEDIEENVFINQKDIRKLQLAKAAIAAGIKTLMSAENLSFNDIDKVYIAGSFGNHLDIKNACRIGMIPNELINKVVLCGNTCLKACEEIICNKDKKEELLNIKKLSKYIELSTSPEFTNYFVDEMAFPEE